MFSLTGCFAEYQPRVTEAAKSKSEEDMKKIIDDLMKNDSYDEYMYTSENKKDPFQSVFMEAVREEQPTLIDRNTQNISSGIQIHDTISELQRFDIDELKLTAIIYGISDRRAILVDPTSKSHIVKEGDFIGRNFGRISGIKQDQVIVQEETYNMQRQKINRNVIISMELQNRR